VLLHGVGEGRDLLLERLLPRAEARDRSGRGRALDVRPDLLDPALEAATRAVVTPLRAISRSLKSGPGGCCCG
jgi:hypothetical protein